MEKSSLRFAADGDYGLLIFTVPAEIAAQSTEVLCYAFPVCKRRGGLTLAVPLAALNSEVLIDNMQREDAGLVGPSKSFSKPLMIEDEEGQVNATTSTCRFMVVDFDDDVLPFLQDHETFDPDSADSVIPFDVDQPAGVPSAEDLVEEVKQWAVMENSGRANFYSAREEQEEDPVVKASAKGAPKKSTQKRLSNAAIMEQVTQLTAAVQALTAKQEEMSRGGLIQNAAASASHAKDPQFGGGRSLVAPQMPGVAESLGIGLSGKSPPTMQIQKALSLVGPPPKVKPVQSEAAQADTFPEDEPKHWSTPHPSADPMVNAMAQQSQALTALVAHFTNSDPMSDLASGGGLGHSSATQRRERLQNDLAMGTSTYFLQVAQQMNRRLNPSRAMANSEAELAASGTSLLTYLERFGGYRRHRENGLVMWVLGHAFDALLVGNIQKAKEHIALFGLRHRAGDDGWRVVGHCIPFVFVRRPTTPSLSGSYDVDAQPRPSLHPIGSEPLVRCGVSLSKRTRDFVYQEDRDKGKGEGKARSYRSSRRCPFVTAEKASFPKEGCKGPEVIGSVKSVVLHHDSACPSEVRCSQAQQNLDAFCPPNEGRSIKGS